MRRTRMKRIVAVSVALVVVMGTVASWASAGLKGSKHDFTTPAWPGFDPCGACHTPASEKPPTEPPLWDTRADLTKRFGRSLLQPSALGTGTVTSLGRFRRTALADSDPRMGTLSCLRCHDGTIAQDATGAAMNRERFVHKQHPGLFTTGHGRTDHPVGVEYPKIAKGYRPLTSVLSGWKVTLPGGRVECSSCHDPHNQSGEKHMLVMSNARSALCLKCHKK
ncbi:MAG: cytochrome c3 family protein [Planctomycetota bacterium]